MHVFRRTALLSLVLAVAFVAPNVGEAWGTLPPQIDIAARYPPGWLDPRIERFPLHSERWRRRVPARCRTRGGFRQFCSGARDVPAPTGVAAELARRLGLGLDATAVQLTHGSAWPEWLEQARGIDPDPSLEWPLPGGWFGRGFGYVRERRIRNRRHNGFDIQHREVGATIVAARGGIVAYSDNGLTGYGNVVLLLHEDDSTTMYAHCRRTLVFAGQTVTRGQPIAEMGRTGFANGPHLHFELRVAGRPHNPTPRFASIPRRPPPPPDALAAR